MDRRPRLRRTRRQSVGARRAGRRRKATCGALTCAVARTVAYAPSWPKARMCGYGGQSRRSVRTGWTRGVPAGVGHPPAGVAKPWPGFRLRPRHRESRQCRHVTSVPPGGAQGRATASIMRRPGRDQYGPWSRWSPSKRPCCRGPQSSMHPCRFARKVETDYPADFRAEVVRMIPCFPGDLLFFRRCADRGARETGGRSSEGAGGRGRVPWTCQASAGLCSSLRYQGRW